LGIVEGAGTIFDILGAPFRYGIELIRGGFMKLFDDKSGLEKQATNLGKFDARVRENLRRFSGLFAPLFKFFGKNDIAKKLQTPGSFGSLYGEKAVKDMGYYGGGKVIKVKKYASGGPVTIERTEVKEVNIERTEKSKVSELNIGSSVGGGINFEKVFPGSMDDPGRMDRYDYMRNAHSSIQGAADIGPVMALTTKTLLGDRVTKDDYDNAGRSLTGFMLRGLQDQNPVAYNSLLSVLDYKQFTGAISIFLMKSMKDPLSGILNLLRVQVGLAPVPGDATGTEADDTISDSDMIEGSVPGGQLTMEQLVGLAKGAGFSDDDAVIMAAIAKGESGGNSNAKNFKPPDKSYGLWQINMIDTLGPARMKQFGLQREDQLFDPVTNAKAAYAIRKSQGLGAWTIYKNGVYKNHLAAARAAKDAPSLSTSPTPTKIKPVSLAPSASGYKPSSPGTFNAIEYITGDMNHPNFELKEHGLTSNYHDHIAFATIADKERAKKALRAANIQIGSELRPGDRGYHGSNLAIDIPGSQWGGSGAIGQKEFDGSAKVRSILGLGGGGVQPGRESGGPTLSGGIRLLHKGEYVIDKDSVDLFGGIPFYSMINGVENEKQRTEKSSQLMQHLSKYTGRKIDEIPPVIVESPEVTYLPSPPIYIPVGSSSFGSSGGRSDYEFDVLESGGMC
jgi:hypothetical protein